MTLLLTLPEIHATIISIKNFKADYNVNYYKYYLYQLALKIL